MIRALFRLLFLGVVVVIVLALFAPRYLEQAGNSLISAFNNSAATGLAQYIPANVNDSNSHLQLSIQGLPVNTKYEVTLDPGKCNGSPNQDIGPITSNANGSVAGEFKFGTLNTAQTWFVDLHQGPTASGTTVACGQLEINKDSASQSNDTTTLSTNGDTFSVSLNPNSNSSGQQTGSNTDDENNEPPTTSSTPTTPKGFPNTGVNPGGKNSYDNTTYPRKF